MPRLIIVICCVWLLSCRNEPEADTRSTNPSQMIPVLEKVLASYYDDMSRRDWVKYREYFWKNATLTTAWQQPGDSVVNVHVVTIDEFIKQTPEGPDSQPVFSERMKNASIQVRNNLASAWVDYDAEFGKPDSLVRWSGTDVFTFLKNQGEWRIVSLVFESN